MPDADVQRAIAAEAMDLRMPWYPDPSDESSVSRTLPILPDLQPHFTALCESTVWGAEGSVDWRPVYLRWLALQPRWTLVPAHGLDGNADFAWARATMLAGSAGLSNWTELTLAARDLYPTCPWPDRPNVRQFEEVLSAAHQLSGWPVVLPHLTWRSLVGLSQEEGDTPPAPWEVQVALFHVLKHLRRAPNGDVVVAYNGMPTRVKPSTASTVLGDWHVQKGYLCRALLAPAKTSIGSAVRAVLSKLTTADLLPLAPLHKISPMILAGPWSTLVPDPGTRDGFYQPGMRIEGVWLARNGRVVPAPSTAVDVVEWDWNVSSAASHDEERELACEIMPRTYEPRWPSDVLAEYFPNWANTDVTRVWLDTVVMSSLLRPRLTREFAREFPLVAFLPDDPAPDQATNQGKTMMAHTLARVMCPGIRPTRAPDSTSAPDQRTLAEGIRTFGTLCLDEWYPPRSPQHLLSHANLQSLVTGGVVATGRALENSEGIHLANPIVLSAKALFIPPDVVNRTLFFYLRQLTAGEFDRVEAVHKLETGEASMQIRLAALAMMQQHNLADELVKMPRRKVEGWRFDALGRLARLLWKLRTGHDDRGQLEHGLAGMVERHQSHTEIADQAGTLDMLESGGQDRVRVTAVFELLADDEMESLRLFLEARRNVNRPGDGNTVREVLDEIRTVKGATSLQNLMRAVSPGQRTASDRAIVRRVSDDIRRVVSVGETWDVPNTQYRLRREASVGGQLRVTLQTID